MSATKLDCPNCGTQAPHLTWQAKAGGGYHLRADCFRCGRYLKFVPQAPPWLELAGPQPASTAGDEQPPLTEQPTLFRGWPNADPC